MTDSVMYHLNQYHSAGAGMGDSKVQSKTKYLVNCFTGVLSSVSHLGLYMKEIFIKRYVVERTNKAERRPEEQSEKTESCRENLWNEIQLKVP